MYFLSLRESSEIAHVILRAGFGYYLCNIILACWFRNTVVIVKFKIKPCIREAYISLDYILPITTQRERDKVADLCQV